ncbi:MULTISPECIES: hypothetical protein [unclassified Mesorhizobium]|uniref:hypothetical protein n=1 Tax=unclassified Mesorhizobium TaxID=325217 RepID=UPI0018DE72E7|nr:MULTISPECIES: hypothetical protein [unclassified Mesorhizobium]WJI84419.1 hypothetical protein NLY34_31020 [Mesorhizobium sp. C374B]WJI90474.1 hypothetical protein NLY42_01755 [Mesorhizobium sp. C372A]
MTQGIRDFKPARRDWREQLETLRTADGRDLPPCLKNEIKRECRRLWQVIEMMASRPKSTSSSTHKDSRSGSA